MRTKYSWMVLSFLKNCGILLKDWHYSLLLLCCNSIKCIDLITRISILVIWMIWSLVLLVHCAINMIKCFLCYKKKNHRDISCGIVTNSLILLCQLAHKKFNVYFKLCLWWNGVCVEVVSVLKWCLCWSGVCMCSSYRILNCCQECSVLQMWLLVVLCWLFLGWGALVHLFARSRYCKCAESLLVREKQRHHYTCTCRSQNQKHFIHV